MQVGDSGAGVTEVQVALTNAGYYSGPISGFYGELTQAAIFRYQLDRGLFVDGIAGPNTLSSLGLDDLAENSRIVGDSSSIDRNRVEDLQSRLQVAGFYSGPIDGEYGSATRDAVFQFAERYLFTIQEVERALGLPESGIYSEEIRDAIISFQIEEGLVADGIVGPVTRERLAARLAGFNQSIVNGYRPQSKSLEDEIREFQEMNRLEVDGIIGRATFGSLIEQITRFSAKSEERFPSCNPGIASGNSSNGVKAFCLFQAVMREGVLGIS
ncbi:MAG: peptidoglycan-binding protein [Cyanobacteria bacterium P01_F01_bin.150]